MKTKAKIIAIAKDGGSQVIEYKGNNYFLDHAINSKTHGILFHGTTREGKQVSQELSNEVKIALIP